MNREELSEVAAGYALDALGSEERARFQALVRAGDPDALAALRDFEATLAGLSMGWSEAPPPRVKAALLARIDRETPVAQAKQPVRPSPSRRRRDVFWPALLFGALAVGLAAVVLAWVVSSSYEQRLDKLAREAAELRAELEDQRAILAILRDPATQVVALRGVGPGGPARGRMMWHARAGGFFVAAGLPALPPGKAYQLWAIAGNNAPVSAGAFTVDAGGAARLLVRQLPGIEHVDAFAVTLEPAGGLPAPSGEMYLLGKA